MWRMGPKCAKLTCSIEQGQSDLARNLVRRGSVGMMAVSSLTRRRRRPTPAQKRVQRKSLSVSHRLANGTLPIYPRFRNLGVFVLAKHSSGRWIDQVNTSADGARHDLIGAIGSSYAGVALHAKPRVRAAVWAVLEGRHNKGITTAARCSDGGAQHQTVVKFRVIQGFHRASAPEFTY